MSAKKQKVMAYPHCHEQKKWGCLLLISMFLILRPVYPFQSAAPFHTRTGVKQQQCCSTTLQSAIISVEQEQEIVLWSQGVAPEGAQLLITDIQDPIPLAAMFWNVISQGSGTALFAFPLATFALAPFAEMVQRLALGIQLTALDDGPCPAMLCEHETEPAKLMAQSKEPAASDEMRRWVQDVIVDSRVCPYTKSADVAGVGVAGVVPGRVGYPVCPVVGADNAATCAVLASFWNNCIDLLNTPPEKLSTILLCAPGVALHSHTDFARIASAILKTVQLAGATKFVSLVFFHPLYDRKQIEPRDRLVHGHLPPHDWLKSYLQLQHTDAEVDALSDQELEMANYQRRSPFFVINVLRADQVALAENVVPWEIIEPEPGRKLRVSGARIYAQNTWRLATQSTRKKDPVTGYEYSVAFSSTSNAGKE